MQDKKAVAAPAKENNITQLHLQRTNDYQFISPLLFVDLNDESEKLTPLKHSIEKIIDQDKANGKINSASVFLKKPGTTEWFNINPNEGFYTASIMKVAVMITILKMSEIYPGYLDKVYPFRYADPRIAVQTFGEKTIIPGQDYKMRDLLKYMIVYSDNYASNILNNLMDMGIYKKLFTDIGIEGYDPDDQYRKLTSSEVSKLFRVLFNSTYLSRSNSEYALSLLTQSTFREGLVKELPANAVVAHKFGEGGGTEENHLSEAGIVYTDNGPYVIVVMMRGRELGNLSQCIADISRTAYDYENPRVIN